MSSNQDSQTDDAQPTTNIMHQHEVTLDMLQKPGVLFEVDDIGFLTTDGPGGVNVIRLATGGRDELDEQLIQDDIENGDLHLVGTHSRHTEVGVNRTVLATLIDYVGEDVEEMPGRVPSDVIEAADDARERLE
jgi:hypothetical protein